MGDYATEWVDLERAPVSGRPQVARLTLSGSRLHLSVAAVRQLREAAGLVAGGGALRVRVRPNREGTKLSVTADPGGLVVSMHGHTSGSRLHGYLGKPSGLIRIDLEWDADQRMFVGEIPPQRA